MSAFFDQVQRDCAAFLDVDGFGELHTIDGKKIPVVLDEDTLKNRQGGAELGVTNSTLLLYARVADLPPRRAPGSVLTLDGRLYTVDDWREDMGIATLSIQQGRV